MENGLVSVVIPTRNRAGYLKQAIDSVYAQTCRHFEIIVIDDGSTDQSREVVRNYDQRLRYFFQAPRGAASARNHGIREANGEFIAFLDDDDLFLPDRLQENIDYFASHPDVVWLCSGFSFIDANGWPLPREPFLPDKTEITLHDIALFFFVNTSTVMVRKKNLQLAGGFPEGTRVSEDYHTWAKVLKTGKGGAIPKCLIRFRLHRGNTKLPWRALLRENTRIIDTILASGEPHLMPRRTYMDNLYRIIGESLLYKRKYADYAGFRLWLKLFSNH